MEFAVRVDEEPGLGEAGSAVFGHQRLCDHTLVQGSGPVLVKVGLRQFGPGVLVFEEALGVDILSLLGGCLE